MTRSTTQITDVTNRLDKKLEASDRLAINESLANHLVVKGLEISDISCSDELLDAILPRMAKLNDDWAQIKCVKDFKMSKMKKKFNDHIQNQKKQPTLLQRQLEFIREQALQVFASVDSQSNNDKSEPNTNSAASKTDKKGKVDKETIKPVSPPSQVEQGAGKHVAQQEDDSHGLDLLPMKRPWTAQHATLINNQIELEDN